MKNLERINRALVVLAILPLYIFISSVAYSALIIDHTCTDISQVQEYWIDQGKDLFKISYGHTSHGSQIVTGMNILKSLYGALYDFNYSGSGGALSFRDYEPSGDLGNPDRTTWAQKTRDLLDTPDNDRNFIMWSWCGQADTTPENMQIYLDLMSGLEADYPDVTFIYMTGHLNGSGEAGNLHQRNNQIRSHVISNNGVLFDFADIESYDPDGNYFLDLGADDGCNYSGGNWADQWCVAHPGDELCTTCSCAHSKPLNCNFKGRAFWWMIARLAGWTGSTTDSDGDGFPDDEDNCPDDYNPDQLDNDPPGGNSCGDACECEGDFEPDGDVDGTDAINFKADFFRKDCSTNPPCDGDFECDGDVDGTDAVKFKVDFFRKDCPSCSGWPCGYE
jgi:hypothetical protein